MDTLKVTKISQDQAWQRTGRAGRESEGFCYRAYTMNEYRMMAAASTPEILRSNISATVSSYRFRWNAHGLTVMSCRFIGFAVTCAGDKLSEIRFPRQAIRSGHRECSEAVISTGSHYITQWRRANPTRMEYVEIPTGSSIQQNFAVFIGFRMHGRGKLRQKPITFRSVHHPHFHTDADNCVDSIWRDNFLPERWPGQKGGSAQSARQIRIDSRRPFDSAERVQWIQKDRPTPDILPWQLFALSEFGICSWGTTTIERYLRTITIGTVVMWQWFGSGKNDLASSHVLLLSKLTFKCRSASVSYRDCTITLPKCNEITVLWRYRVDRRPRYIRLVSWTARRIWNVFCSPN